LCSKPRSHVGMAGRMFGTRKPLPFYEAEAKKRQAHGQTAPGRTLTQKNAEASEKIDTQKIAERIDIISGEAREKAARDFGTNRHRRKAPSGEEARGVGWCGGENGPLGERAGGIRMRVRAPVHPMGSRSRAVFLNRQKPSPRRAGRRRWPAVRVPKVMHCGWSPASGKGNPKPRP